MVSLESILSQGEKESLEMLQKCLLSVVQCSLQFTYLAIFFLTNVLANTWHGRKNLNDNFSCSDSLLTPSHRGTRA